MFTLYAEHKYTYTQWNVGCRRVRTGVYGCRWVCMGAVGCTGTNAQKNKTKRDTNEFAWYDFRAWYGREISPKKHICADRHKGVTRDSGGC